jgi:hypothetical protein
MKRIVIVSSLLILLAASSCSKFLDVQPKQTFGENLAVSDIQGLSNTVIGAYSKLQSGNLYGGGIIANSELLADYVSTDVISDYSLAQFRDHSINPYNSQAVGMWTDGYNAIMIANTVLKYLPKFENGKDSVLARSLRGNCYFIRAIMMYELVKMFAQPSGYTADDSHMGIPIVLSPGSVDQQQSNPRASVAQVYAQITADLKAAEPLMDNDNSIYIANKYAVEAFLAKVYFTQNKLVEAEKYSSMIINSNVFNMQDSLAQVYNSITDPQAIFQIVNLPSDKDNGSLYGRFSTPPFGSTVPMYRMNGALKSTLATLKAYPSLGDKRYKQLYKYSFGYYLCKKYDNQNISLVVVRLAEIYLIEAECLARAGREAEARDLLNKIRIHAGALPDNGATGSSLIRAIWQERDFELAMEGDHFSEIKRRCAYNLWPGQVPVFSCQDRNRYWNDNDMIYPIPQQELDQNKAMRQNPGY